MQTVNLGGKKSMSKIFKKKKNELDSTLQRKKRD